MREYMHSYIAYELICLEVSAARWSGKHMALQAWLMCGPVLFFQGDPSREKRCCRIYIEDLCRIVSCVTRAKEGERGARDCREGCERRGEVEGEKKILKKMWVGDRRVAYLCLAYSLSGLLNLELDVGRIFRILFPLKSCREIGNYWRYSRQLQWRESLRGAS